MSARAELGAAGLQNHGRVGHETLHHVRQFEASLWTEFTLPGKLDVRDQAEEIVAIFLHQAGGVFKIGTQQNSRPRLHAHKFVRHVDAFLNHAPRLFDQLGIDNGQERGVVANVVFDHEQHGNAHGVRVVEDVALVLDIFDDRNQNASIALPEEDSFDIGDWIARDEILDLAMVVAEHDDRNIEPGSLDFTRQLRSIHVADGEVGDDQVELA